MKTTENILPASIEFRALNFMSQGMDAIEAVKQALIEETNFIGSLINSSSKLTSRGQIAADYTFNRVCRKLKKRK